MDDAASPASPAGGPRASSVDEAPDAELVRRTLEGDRIALAALIRRYDRRLYRTARSILRDESEAEDAVQETFLLAYKALGAFRDEATLSTWLVRIAVNVALARLRKRAQQARATEASAHLMSSLSEREQKSGSPDQLADRADVRRLIERQIDALPPPYATVFVLRALEELSADEIAAALGIKKATVRSRYARARKLLQRSLSEKLAVFAGDAFGFAGARCQRIVSSTIAKIEAMERDRSIPPSG